MSTQPASTTRQETAGVVETAADSFEAPGSPSLEPERPEVAIARLEAFLSEEFPDEFTRTNRQVDEPVVDMAMRLLSGLHAHKAAGAPDVRCDQEFCNKPNGHRDAHGWVHFAS